MESQMKEIDNILDLLMKNVAVSVFNCKPKKSPTKLTGCGRLNRDITKQSLCKLLCDELEKERKTGIHDMSLITSQNNFAYNGAIEKCKTRIKSMFGV